ncbi:MAG: hypothetical protein ACHQWU_05205 [Gemmatimonadales bacterium]
MRDTSPRGDMLPNDLALSPNGRLIAYSRGRELRIRDVATQSDTLLLRGAVHTFMWSPRGDAILMGFRPTPADNRSVWAVQVDSLTGRMIEPIHHVSPLPINHAPIYSPDEQWVAFAEAIDGTASTALVVVPAQGGEARTLAVGPDIKDVRWTPDGRGVYFALFTDSSTSRRELRRIPRDSGPMVFVDTVRYAGNAFRDPATGRVAAYLETPPDISISDWATRATIAGVRERHPRGMQIVSLATGARRDAIDTTAEAGPSAWFTGSDRIASLVRERGRTSIVVSSVNGVALARIPIVRAPPPTTAPSTLALRVSPDGRYAAFVGESGETIELVDLRSRKQRTLTAVFGNARAPEGKGISDISWSPDSRHVRYIAGVWTPSWREARDARLDGTDVLIRRYSSTDIRPGPGTVLSPDGRETATIVRASRASGSASIALRSANDSTVRSIALTFHPLPTLDWYPDGRHILVLGRLQPGGVVNAYEVDLNTGTARGIVTTHSRRVDNLVSISPDGRYLAITNARVSTAQLLRLDYPIATAP